MRYLLIDGNHLAGRSRAALKDLTLASGHRSGTVTGVLRGLSHIRRTLRIEPEQTVVCWDYGRSEVRMQLYPEYKAGRIPKNPTPEEELEFQQYCVQLNALRECLSYSGYYQVRVHKVEADDLLSILATKYARLEPVIIYSGDYDVHQLASARVSIFDPKRELIGVPEILEIWGLDSIELLPLYKAIVGDSSDNISGVKQVGHKRAQIVLRYLRPTESGFSCASEIPMKDRKWVDRVREYIDQVVRNYKLVKLPREWEESYYTVGQGVEAMGQLQMCGVDRIRIFRFLKAWEQGWLLENMNRW